MNAFEIKLNKKIIFCTLLLLLLLVLLCSAAWCSAATNTDLVRVGLIQNASSISFTLQGDYRLIDVSTGQSIAGSTTGNWVIKNDGGKCQVFRDDKALGLFVGPVRAESQSQNLNLAGVTNGGQAKQYRGNIEVRGNAGGLTLINELPVEEYLYGVVPSEMPATFPVEALKAQAVAARSYALSHLGRYEASGFDILNNQSDQVYKGFAGEHPVTVSAVDDTKDLVLVYDNQIVEAFFHASSGGYTENSEDVWVGQLGYIKTKTDTYDYNEQYYNWSVTYTGTELTALINQQMQKRAPAGYTPFATITGLTNSEMTASGHRVKKLLVQGIDSAGKAHSYTFANSDQVRSCLGLKSALFTTSQQKTASGAISSVTFKGSGIGHGLGMSQYGAAGMANAGNSFEEILQYYYTDVELLPYSSTLN